MPNFPKAKYGSTQFGQQISGQPAPTPSPQPGVGVVGFSPQASNGGPGETLAPPDTQPGTGNPPTVDPSPIPPEPAPAKKKSTSAGPMILIGSFFALALLSKR